MISPLKEMMKKWLLILKCEHALDYIKFEESDELMEINTIFPEFNHHNHYYGRLYQCNKCCEYVTVENICYVSVEMFQAEYYYCAKCTSN